MVSASRLASSSPEFSSTASKRIQFTHGESMMPREPRVNRFLLLMTMILYPPPFASTNADYVIKSPFQMNVLQAQAGSAPSYVLSYNWVYIGLCRDNDKKMEAAIV